MNRIGKSFAQGRIWVVALWAFPVATLTAGADLALRGLHERAAERSVLLVASEQPNEAERTKLAAEAQRRAEVKSARWLSPKSLAQQASSVIRRDLWPEVFDEQDTWLPWVMEARFADPLAGAANVDRFLTSMRAERVWKLVLWDGAALEEDRARKARIVWIFGPAGAAMLVLGAVALMLGAAPRGDLLMETIMGATLAMGLTASAGLCALYSGAIADARAWALGLGVSFALAALAAPVLKGPRSPRETAPAQAPIDE